jgi:hypothetical protein
MKERPSGEAASSLEREPLPTRIDITEVGERGPPYFVDLMDWILMDF